MLESWNLNQSNEFFVNYCFSSRYSLSIFCSACRNVLRIMTATSRTVETGDLLRRLDGGSTMIKFNHKKEPHLIICHSRNLLAHFGRQQACKEERMMCKSVSIIVNEEQISCLFAHKLRIDCEFYLNLLCFSSSLINLTLPCHL